MLAQRQVRKPALRDHRLTPHLCEFSRAADLSGPLSAQQVILGSAHTWFSTVKSEEAERFESYAQAKETLFDCIEVFYNQRRRHSTLGQISPAEFERRATQAA